MDAAVFTKVRGIAANNLDLEILISLELPVPSPAENGVALVVTDVVLGLRPD